MTEQEKLDRKLKFVIIAFLIFYLTILSLLVLRCLKSKETMLKIERLERECYNNLDESDFEYKDLSKIDLSTDDLSKGKKAYYDYLYKKCQE